jgi:hypothetical protein
MALRNPDPEIVEDIVREEADDVNGLLNLPEARQAIQQKYRERYQEKHGRVSSYAPKASHEDIRSILQDFASDDQRDIQHVDDEVYFDSPFTSLNTSGEREVLDRLTDIYHLYVVFSGVRIRQEFDVPVNNSEFFLKRLEEQELVERLSHAQDVFTIGQKLAQITDEPSIEEQLRERATEGIIKNDKFEEIIDAPATEEVVSLFVNRDYLVDMDGEYLVESALNDYIDRLTREVLPGIETKFENADYAMRATEYRSAVNQSVREQSDLLSHAPNMEDDILEGVREGVRDDLDLESVTHDGRALLVQREEFEAEVESVVDSVSEEVLSQDHTRAGDYFDAADDRIETVGIPGGAAVNDYYRETIRDRCHDRINQEAFSDDR